MIIYLCQLHWKFDKWGWTEHEIGMESKFDLESEDFNLDQIIDSVVDWVSSPSVPNLKTEIPILPSNEYTPFI